MNLPHTLATFWGLYAIALLATLTRLLARVLSKTALRIDDYFSLFSFGALTVLTALYSVMIPRYLDVQRILSLAGEGSPAGGAGRDAIVGRLMGEPVLRGEVESMLRYSFATIVLFWLVVWSVKFSVLFFFRRFLDSVPTYMDGWYIVFGFTTMNLLGCLLIQFLGCIPFSSNFSIAPSSCFIRHPGNPGQLYGTTALDIVSDIMIIVLPMRLLFGLRVNKKQKAGLAGVFALGAVIIVFAIVRAAQVSSAGRGMLGGLDFLWLGVWSQAEGVSAVTVACAPQIWIWAREKSGHG